MLSSMVSERQRKTACCQQQSWLQKYQSVLVFTEKTATLSWFLIVIKKMCSWRLWLEVICQDDELHNLHHVYTSVGPTGRRDDFLRCPECLLKMKLSCQRKMWPKTIPECILVVILITPSLSLPHITMNIFLLSGVLNRNGSRVLELWLNHPYMHSIGGLCSWKWSLESDS